MTAWYSHDKAEPIQQDSKSRATPYFLIGLVLIGLFAAVQPIPSTAQTAVQANPGETNPIVPFKRRTFFPNQDIFASINPLQDVFFRIFEATNQNVDLKQVGTSPFFQLIGNNGQIWSEPGRILAPDFDSIAVSALTSAGIRTVILNQSGRLADNSEIVLPAFSDENFWTFNSNTAGPFQASGDLATGELSTRIDFEGVGHDEVAVCYLTQDPYGRISPTLTVLDYTDFGDSGLIEQTTALATEPINLASYKIDNGSRPPRYPISGKIACATGDLNADGTEELVLAHIRGEMGLFVEVFSYTNNGTDPPTLTSISRVRVEPSRNNFSFAANVDVVVDNLDGIGREKIAVSNTIATSSNELETIVNVITSDKDFTLTPDPVTFSPGGLFKRTLPGTTSNLFGDCNRIRGQHCPFPKTIMKSGLIRFNPPSGFDFDRHQLVIAQSFTSQASQPDQLPAGGYSVGTISWQAQQQTPFTLLGSTERIMERSPLQFIDAAVGGFGASFGDGSNPNWSLTVGTFEIRQDFPLVLTPAFVTFDLILDSFTMNSAGSPVHQDNLRDRGFNPIRLNTRNPVVAVDRRGQSVYLGSPIRLTLYDLIDTKFIIQEPPKHTFWQQNGIDPFDGEIVNVSRFGSFVVELEDEQSVTFEHTDTKGSDWVIGGSVAVSASATVSGGFPGIKKGSATQKSRVEIGYDYSENQSSYDQDYRSQTQTMDFATEGDDAVRVELLEYDVWRYPLFGADVDIDGGAPQAFWEISFPAATGTLNRSAGGLGAFFDWYQPRHENGNILSYPRTIDIDPPIDCCAPFTFIEDGQEVTQQIPFMDSEQLEWGGITQTIRLNFSEASGSGSEKSYEHTLKESLDFSVGFKAKVGVFGVGSATVSGQVDTNINNSNSWSNSSSTSNQTNNSTGFTVQKPSGSASQGYVAKPVIYLAEDGSTKTNWGVDMSGNLAFWGPRYGTKPDPALNLPKRFVSVDVGTPTNPGNNVWVVNPEPDVFQIRGFFLKLNELNPETNIFPALSGASIDGDETRIEVRIHNYSLAERVNDLDVRFEIATFNPISFETGPREPLICGAGSNTQGLFIDPLEFTTAVCTWDTTGLSPGVPGSHSDYTIYAVLDPDDKIDEIYEDIGPGQNNVGWRPVSVASRVDTYLLPTPTESVPNGGDVSLDEFALAIEVDGKFKTDSATVTQLQAAPLRVCASSDQTHTGYYHVLIWDRDPKLEGASWIQDGLLAGIDKTGNSCVWVRNFRPKTLGRQTLYAEILEHPDDGRLGNAVDTLDILVEPIPTPPVNRAKGIARKVSSGRENGRLNLKARFTDKRRFDLSDAVVVFDKILFETNSTRTNPELIAGLSGTSGQPLVLNADRRSSKNRAVFRSRPEQGPRVLLLLERRNRKLTAKLWISGAEILAPEFCRGTTRLETKFRVLDGEQAPFDLTFTRPWQCKTKRDVVTKLILK